MKEKMVSDLRYYFLDIVLISIIGYLFYIIIGKMLTPLQYGVMMTSVGLFTVLSPLTSIGFNEALARFLPIVGKNKIRTYIVYSLKKVIIVSVLFSFILTIVSFYVYSDPEIIQAFVLLALMIVFGSLTLVLKGVLQGLKKFLTMFIADSGSQIFRLIIPIMLVSYGFGATGALAGWVIGFIIFILATGVYLNKHFNVKNTLPVKKEFYAFGISAAFFSSAMWLLIQSGILIFSIFDMNQAGLFGVSIIFGQVILSIPLIVTGVLLPYLSQLFARNKINRARKIIQISLKNIALFLLPLCIFIIIFSKQLILKIYNLSYIDANIFFPFMIPAFMLLSINLILLTSLYAYGKHVLRLIYISVASFMTIILSIPFYYAFGPVGISYSYFLSQIIILIFLSIGSYKIMGQLFSKKLINSIPAMIIFALLIYLISNYGFNLLYSILFVLVSSVVYVFLLKFLKVFEKHDSDLARLFLKLK